MTSANPCGAPSDSAMNSCTGASLGELLPTSMAAYQRDRSAPVRAKPGLERSYERGLARSMSGNNAIACSNTVNSARLRLSLASDGGADGRLLPKTALGSVFNDKATT